MVDMGYCDVATACPYEGCDGAETVRMFGQDEGVYYRTVKCPTCAKYYGVKVTLTISGTVTEYSLTDPV